MEELNEFEELSELLDAKKYTRLRQRLAEENDADVAAFLESLEEKEDLLKVFRILPKSQAANVFSYLDVDNQHFVIMTLSGLIPEYRRPVLHSRCPHLYS